MYDDEDAKPEEEIYDGEKTVDEPVEGVDEETISKLEELMSKEVEEATIVEDTFCVRSSQGVSINSVNFCRGTYKLGQLVGTMIITEDIRDNILSLDAQSIVTNPHLAM